MNILVTGGAGYIGSHLVHDLVNTDHNITVLDNLSSGFEKNIPSGVEFINADLTNPKLVDILRNRQFDVVFHFAAKKAAGESMEKPELYMRENLGGAVNLISLLPALGVKYFILSSTAAVYGTPDKIPVNESAPTVPINYYGYTKLAIEQNLAWFSQIYGIRYAALRYFNAAGYDPLGRVKEREKGTANLLPVVLETVSGLREKLMVFGNDYTTPDGTCIRDYIHPSDLASAHMLALDYLIAENKNLTVNLGTGSGHSVMEVINAAQRLSGLPLKYEIVSRREGDPASLIADQNLARTLLNWAPRHSSLDSIISSMLPLYLK
ncbi:MAG: UDP-glucose 4-epimerase GalE [Ignavibacteriaceae bacterium]|nr:UDP-glucose 4-epimerase GalE [Ignavibacteriaceae bacterium]